jgi:hypothetical protein
LRRLRQKCHKSIPDRGPYAILAAGHNNVAIRWNRWSMIATFRKFLLALTAASAALAAPVGGPASAQDARIELNIGKITFLVGGSGGFGTLYFGGQAFSLAIGGVTAGATVSFSRANLVGNVFNLQDPYDIEGIYTAGTAGFAAAGGQAFVQLTNSKGVMISLSGRQLGLDASLDLSGMRISIY